MAKIVLTDAKMNMLQNVWTEINALGEVNVAESDKENNLIKEVSEADARLDRECYYSAKRILSNKTLVNVKNGDALAALGEPVRWFPYGELPSALD